jgi:DNA-binding transcriptional ArsR family regulator
VSGPTNLNIAFAALADPTRRAILARLATGEDVTVLDLAAPFAISLPAISKHLKVLERAGLVSRSRHAQSRPCRLRVEALAEASQWIEHTRQAWDARLDRLDAYVQALQAQSNSIGSKNSKKEKQDD